jgi:hypothetical protein
MQRNSLCQYKYTYTHTQTQYAVLFLSQGFSNLEVSADDFNLLRSNSKQMRLKFVFSISRKLNF